MTTTQESTNGHRLSPPPCSFPDSQDQNRSEDSTDNNSNSASATPQPEAFAASAYHVPPKLYAPKADSFHDTIPDGLSTMKMPDRCQFMFSDGRQCTMARSDIHPSLCPYHSEREEQLFGTPGSLIRGPSFDLPELFSASRDLTTATGVNRALGQVFRLLAQRRISRQEAATFAKLAQLLLQSISAASQEQPITEIVPRQKGVSSRESHDDQKLSRITKSTPLLPHNEVLSPVNKVQTERRAQCASRMPLREISPEIPTHKNRAFGHQTASAAVNSPAPPMGSSASAEPLAIRTADNNSSGMNTSAPSSCNSREINTSENIGFNPVQNEHLRDTGSDFCSSGHPAVFLQRGT